MTNQRANALRIAVLGFVLVASGVVLAASNPKETIETRQKNLKTLGGAFKDIRDEVRKSAPDAAKLKSTASDIAKLASQMHTWFPQGTGPESKVETDAKAEIWSDPTGFAAALKNFQAEAPKFAELANANDVAGVKAAVGKLGGTCKGCHDKYRVPQD